jgi:hypothetical protein
MDTQTIDKFEDNHNSPKVECSICGFEYDGHGHNAASFPGRCCADCYVEIVAPVCRTARHVVKTDRRQKPLSDRLLDFDGAPAWPTLRQKKRFHARR